MKGWLMPESVKNKKSKSEILRWQARAEIKWKPKPLLKGSICPLYSWKYFFPLRQIFLWLWTRQPLRKLLFWIYQTASPPAPAYLQGQEEKHLKLSKLIIIQRNLTLWCRDISPTRSCSSGCLIFCWYLRSWHSHRVTKLVLLGIGQSKPTQHVF